MTAGGRAWSWVAGVFMTIAGPAAAQEPDAARAMQAVLVTPVQGSASIPDERRARVADAVGRALEERDYAVLVDQDLLAAAVLACQTPECVEQNLDAAGAELAVVPAVWVEPAGGEELTLTLLQRAGRNLNASGRVGAELSDTATALVGTLLAKRAASTPAAVAAVAPEPQAGFGAPGEPGPKHPHAWKAGPIVLIAGGAAAFVAIGVGAAVKRDDQQLNRSAVAAWSAVGAAAIAGGVAWWVVGAKRRRLGSEPSARRAPLLGLHPTRIDLRLRF